MRHGKFGGGHLGGWSGHGGFGPGGGWGGAGRGGPPPWLAGLLQMAQSESKGWAPPLPRARRGDVRAAILDVLAGGPRNGYQLIGEIAERSGGAWKPSPGSIYPTLAQLEDEGLVWADAESGRRSFRLTAAGEHYLDAHPEEIAAVWRPFADDPEADQADGGFAALKPELGKLMSAVWQIVTTGSQQQQRDAIAIVIETRRKLYGLLADEADEDLEAEPERPADHGTAFDFDKDDPRHDHEGPDRGDGDQPSGGTDSEERDR